MTFGLALVVINRHEIDLQLRALFALLIHLHFDMGQLLSLGSSESRRLLLQQCYEDSSRNDGCKPVKAENTTTNGPGRHSKTSRPPAPLSAAGSPFGSRNPSLRTYLATK